MLFFFFFKQKTAYEMRISDWSSDVCSSDLIDDRDIGRLAAGRRHGIAVAHQLGLHRGGIGLVFEARGAGGRERLDDDRAAFERRVGPAEMEPRHVDRRRAAGAGGEYSGQRDCQNRHALTACSRLSSRSPACWPWASRKDDHTSEPQPL